MATTMTEEPDGLPAPRRYWCEDVARVLHVDNNKAVDDIRFDVDGSFTLDSLERISREVVDDLP